MTKPGTQLMGRDGEDECMGVWGGENRLERFYARLSNSRQYSIGKRKYAEGVCTALFHKSRFSVSVGFSTQEVGHNNSDFC